MRDDLVVADLVARAGNGEEQAWDALVERYSPLPANLVDLPQAPAGGRRRLRRRPEHLATGRGPAG